MADKLYQPANSDEIKAIFLRDIRLAAIDAGQAEPPTTPGTDWDYLATAMANISLLGFANINASEDDTSLLTATGQALEDIRIAEGLPEVGAAGATGKLVVSIAGATTIPNGLKFTLPNGLTGQVVGTYVGPADGDEISVAAIDTGTRTNLKAGEKVQFRSPPVNVATEAKVSTGEPLTGGTDIETDDRKRARILDARRNKPAGGNWAHIRKIALESLGSLIDVYVYPALGGPGSCKVVPVKDFDLTTGDFSRTVPSSALSTVRNAIQAQLPSPSEIVVQAAVNESADFTILLTIPDSALAGGNGRGWTDAAPWPPLVFADLGLVSITAINSTNDIITVDAATTTAPVAGQTHISWWSSVDRKFYTSLVTAQSGATTAWVLTLERPLVGKNGAGPLVGDYISPAAQNLEKYGATWVDIFRDLGPGENKASASNREKRHPFVTDEDPSSLTNTALTKLAQRYSEITDIQYANTAPTTPTVPGLLSTAPNVLVPRKFGIYKIT